MNILFFQKLFYPWNCFFLFFLATTTSQFLILILILFVYKKNKNKICEREIIHLIIIIIIVVIIISQQNDTVISFGTVETLEYKTDSDEVSYSLVLLLDNKYHLHIYKIYNHRSIFCHHHRIPTIWATTT